MEEIIFETRIKVYPVSGLPAEYRELAAASFEATRTAYAPYSTFHVGAAVLLENGVIVKGSNQENAAYPSGLCAERVAVFYAGAQYPEVAVRAIAISAQTQGRQVERISPCGACRQVLLEAEIRSKQPIRILLCGPERVYVAGSAADLLPLSFDGSELADH
jgi:cytidine deaminase